MGCLLGMPGMEGLESAQVNVRDEVSDRAAIREVIAAASFYVSTEILGTNDPIRS